MCQLCGIKELAALQRWPKAVEAAKSDLNFLVDSIHDEWTRYQDSKTKLAATPLPESLLELCRLLVAQLDDLEVDRETWWTSPESRAKRQRFELEGNQRNLSELHKINNNTISSFESLQAKLGGFVKWSLGMKGGVFELKHAHKVATGN
jgi:hypothetical protein